MMRMLLGVCVVLGLITGTSGACKTQDELVHVQVWHRHGARQPGDPIDPFTTDFWAQLGYPGGFTSVGLEQMKSLGNFLRREYIDLSGLMPPTLVDDRVIFAQGSAQNVRSHRSAMAVVEALYPGDAVPVFFNDPAFETLLLPSNFCPSYAVEYPRISALVEQQYIAQYADLISNVSVRTGWASAGIELGPLQLLQFASENIEYQIEHNYDVDPYLLEQFPLIEALYANSYYQGYINQNVNDVRGPIGQTLGLEMLANFQSVLDGGPVRMHLYPAQWATLVTIFISLGVITPEYNPHVGDALLLETSRSGCTGELVVRARLATLGPDHLTYEQPAPRQLLCPTPQDECRLADLMAYLEERHPANPDPQAGCCLIGPGFFDLGCNDYTNPATLDRAECLRFRYVCPEVACGPLHVVEHGSLLCVPRQ